MGEELAELGLRGHDRDLDHDLGLDGDGDHERGPSSKFPRPRAAGERVRERGGGECDAWLRALRTFLKSSFMVWLLS
jgi:hypothetical protein